MDVFCITSSNPQFQKLLAESGEKQGVFAMMVSKWMTESGIHNRYPTLQELGITAMKSAKPGVVELFNSNPELASAVYEALGFETELPSVDNIIETENKQDKKEKLNKRRELVLKEINAIEELISTNPDEITIYETKDYEYDFNASHYFDKSNWELSNSKYKTSRVITKPSYLHSHLDEELQKRVKNLQIINSSLFNDVEKINYSNVFKEGKSYSSLEVLKYISNNKKDVLSEIAKTLIKYAEKNNVEIQILKREPKTPAGRYKVYQNKIEIFGKEHTTSHTLIHEIVHSFSSRYIYDNPKSYPVLQLNAILKNILNKNILKEYSNFEGSYEDYATKNIHELLTEIISRPDILSHLALYDTNYNLIKDAYKKETLLDQIVKILSDIFNFTKKESETLADLILVNAKDIFENSSLINDFNNNQITPQQKQQAQQLYSQYLDTIFPDSQVKGINYHGTEYQQKFEKFDSKLSGTQTKEELITNGFWFTYQKDVAEDFGSNVLSVLLNIRNPYRAEARLTDSFPYIKTFPDQVESVNKAIKEGYDSAFIDVLENLEYGRGTTELVVFEPEQIHILGSKQDIEGFKDFVDKPATSKLASTAKKSDEDIIEELVQENKLERKCQ